MLLKLVSMVGAKVGDERFRLCGPHIDVSGGSLTSGMSLMITVVKVSSVLHIPMASILTVNKPGSVKRKIGSAESAVLFTKLNPVVGVTVQLYLCTGPLLRFCVLMTLSTQPL